MSAHLMDWPKTTIAQLVIDTSVLIAILTAEPERESFMRIIARASQVFISSASLLEARVVLYQKRARASISDLDEFIATLNIQIIAPDAAQIDLATDAFIIYGKGNGHKAQLNFGDLFSYALAKSRKIPLLFKGEDFAHTDVASALSAQSKEK